ncbi:MAG: hypothetical protein ACI4WW_02720 [Candidatus Coprovivens sp.]
MDDYSITNSYEYRMNSIKNNYVENKLNIETFLKGINYIKGNYINWNFDIQNKIMVNVWFDRFKNLDSSVFIGLIKEYCEKNQYPPNNPQQILSLYKSDDKNGKQALEWIYDLNREYPFNNEYQRPKFYQELSQDNLAYSLFKKLEMWNLFDDNLEVCNTDYISYALKENHKAFVDFGKSYIEDKFICWYNDSKNPITKYKIKKNSLQDEE